MSIAIALNKVVKTYAELKQPAVQGLSLQVNEGEIYGLLGPNGAGKSTSVMMICRTYPLQLGEINVLGFDAKGKSATIRSLIGVAPQEIALFPYPNGRGKLDVLWKHVWLARKKIKGNDCALCRSVRTHFKVKRAGCFVFRRNEKKIKLDCSPTTRTEVTHHR